MKDELEELVMDESARRTATDWLMQVISGKRTNGHVDGGEHNGAERNGAERNGAQRNSFHQADGLVISGSAVAVADMPPAATRQREEEPCETAQEFSAEDLCGAPVVPVIKVTPKNEITADDVCWVPEELRLKPQPAVTEPAVAEEPPAPVAEQPPAATSKVHVMQPREEREDVDLRRQGGIGTRDPELTHSTGGAAPGVTAAEISREPAPYMVEPTFSGMESGPDRQEVTAADITRESVRTYTPVPSGSDLPTSFRVIRSVAPTPAQEAAAPVIKAPAPVIEAAVPVIEAPAPVESVAVPAEAPAPVAAAAVVESAATAGGTASEAPEAAIAEPAMETAAPEAEVAAPAIEAAKAPVEYPEAASEIGEVETSPEQDEADAHEIEEALEHPEEFTAQELPAELQPEAGAEGEDEKATANVFAREGFWGSAAEVEAADGEVPSKAIQRGMSGAYAAAPGSADFEKHPEGWFSAWKTMLRLGSVLPWVARALPALESSALGVEPGSTGAPGAPGATGIAQETRQDVAGLRLVQYEIRTTVQDHSMQLKRMEEQLTRVRESVDSRSSENAEVAENLRTMTKLVRLAGMGLGALLLVLIVLVIVMVARH